MSKIEILAPVGNEEMLRAAVFSGADAVYLGFSGFNARTSANNFNADTLKDAVAFCHARGVAVHVALNTTVYGGELPALEQAIRAVAASGADAVICQDLAVATLIGKIAPQLPRHGSTQMSVHSLQGALELKELGFTRVVLAREMSLQDIAILRDKTPPELEIEAFVHGAMCISYSGRCLLSHYFTGRDANLGACTHPCRWKYYIMEEKRPGEFLPVEENERGTYIFNSKDLCMIEHIPELVNAGIDSFKIEGRMKTALYVAVVSRTYRQAIDDYFEDPQKYIDNIPYYKKEIAKCTYRQFTTGFFFGPTTHDSQIYDNNTYVKGYEYLGTIHESLEDGRGVFEQKNKFSVGDEVEIMKPTGENIVTKVLSMQDEKGENVDSCPHPGQRITLQTECTLQEYDIIRKEKEVSGDECEGGSACHS